MSLRQEVLSLYRHILRLSRSWQAANTADTSIERNYIKEEARTIFRQNKQLESEEEIKQSIQEANARIQLAQHYNTPYSRPINFPQHAMPFTARKMHGSRRVLKQAKPIYAKSTYQETDKD